METDLRRAGQSGVIWCGLGSGGLGEASLQPGSLGGLWWLGPFAGEGVLGTDAWVSLKDGLVSLHAQS